MSSPANPIPANLAAMRLMEQPQGPAALVARNQPAMPEGMSIASPQQITRVPTAQETQLATDQAKLAQLTKPSTPFHELSRGHKIARVFADIGNAAGDVFAPGTMALIPGTALNKERQEDAMAKRVNLEEQEESQNELRGAQAKNLENETQIRNEEEPGKEALNTADIANKEAGTENIQSETANRNEGGTMELQTYRSLVALGMTPSAALAEVEKERQMALRPQTVTPEQQFIDAQAAVANAKTPEEKAAAQRNLDELSKAERGYTLNTQRPPQTLMFMPNQQGGQTAENIRPGTTIAPGAQTAAGVNAVSTPTAQQRTAAARADMAAQEVPGITVEVQQLASQLGPVMGRWNEFMQGKVGAPNPAIAKLRSDLVYLSSAVALAHAVGRLPENLREEFDTMINAPQQSPENIIAVLGATQKWMQDNANAMRNLKPLGQTQSKDGYYEKGGRRFYVSGGNVYATVQ